jgi:hypothetical protein
MCRVVRRPKKRGDTEMAKISQGRHDGGGCSWQRQRGGQRGGQRAQRCASTSARPVPLAANVGILVVDGAGMMNSGGDTRATAARAQCTSAPSTRLSALLQASCSRQRHPSSKSPHPGPNFANIFACSCARGDERPRWREHQTVKMGSSSRLAAFSGYPHSRALVARS